MTDPRKTALVTGGNKGIGREIARQLAERGYHVWIGCRDVGRGEAAAAELGDAVSMVQLDVTDGGSVAAAARTLTADAGHLDVLVNNAGIASPLDGHASEVDVAAFPVIFDTNVVGVARVTQAMLPLVRKSPAGRIVMISSGAGSLSRAADPADHIGKMKAVAYCASKAALNAYTINLANELRDTHIKVNAVNPGHVGTDINNHSGPRTVAQGAEAAITMATLGDDGPTGGFFNDRGAEPW